MRPGLATPRVTPSLRNDMLRRLFELLLRWSALAAAILAVPIRGAVPEAIAIVTGDMHSAYDRTAQFVAHVDRIRAENPGVPVLVLINGDTFELGNGVARRSAGAIEYAMFAALARRGPTVLNLGNHEPEFAGVAETVAKIQATGVIVIGGNVLDRATGQPYAPGSARVPIGPLTATIAGVTTDALATFRAPIRPTLDLRNPVTWAQQNLPTIFREASLPILLSHAGLAADRQILPLVPDGTLFAGAHNHLRFVHQAGPTTYFHSGSWTESLSVARLSRTPAGPRWAIEIVPIAPGDPAHAELATLIRETLAQHLTTEERAVVGHSARALGPGEAAEFAVEAARRAARADVALIGGTTFGAGVPAGDVTRFALDTWVRFDGTLWIAEIEGSQLAALLRRANHGPDTPFADRTGENLVATSLTGIEPGRTCRLVTTDWIARNPRQYLGESPPALTEQPNLMLKAAVIQALGAARP